MYACADVLVLPSLYEGFGLPPLEAMACGVPVVVSNTSSLPEVVGDAGLLIHPEKPDMLAEGLNRALTDTQWREHIIPKGIAQAKRFTWANSAKIAWSVYQNML
ncbi:MAG: glycosyltransferase [Anaerolineae bacterium]|nr:glycosyltransferase [Anaerolineae bacterium]